MRVGIALVIGAGTWAVTHSLWVLPWLAAVMGTQLLDFRMTAPMRADPNFTPTPRQEAVYLALFVLHVAVYSSITPFCWLLGGLEGHLFAILIPTAGLLNVALQAQSEPKLFWAGCAPHALYLLSLPVLSIAFEITANPVGMGFVGLGAVLYIAHLFIALGRNRRFQVELAAAVDVAEREQARAQEASAAKSDFLATMSHEIRTPLNGVLGMVQAMAKDDLPKRQRERLEVVRQSGEVLLVLLNDLLDISKIEAAKLDLEIGVLDLGELAAQAEAAFAPLAASKGLDLRITAAPDATGPWRADSTRVRQIFHNLLANAVKFTETGGISATLFEAEGRVALQVRDTGPGVPPEQLPTLFDRFIQADASMTRRYGGSGLGLAISRELALRMGGEITVESAVGRGSTFTVWLPLERAEMADVRAPAAPAAAAPAPPQALTESPAALSVLVAEDNETNRLVLGTLLDQLGIAAEMTEHGEEAVEAWRRGRFDLILMDVQMPVMDGLSATRRIREIEVQSGRPRTPIIALTANAMSHHLAEYAEAGMDGVAAKPIELNRLLEQMNLALAAAAGEESAATAATAATA